ncbi:MAG: hypothetical protein NVS3B15_10590 [Sediminibacterium sp.]
MQGMKQGKWKLQAPPLRGESGYEEEGTFVNNKREGIWRKFNLMGDVLAVENYKWGNKNGVCRYFSIAGLEREENWLSINPDKIYDTIDVQDVKDPTHYNQVVIKNEGNSLRHGTWKFYFPASGQLLRTERYLFDKLQVPGAEPDKATITINNKTADTTTLKKPVPSAASKPKQVLEFEKKNAGKKKTRVRDGKTGG